MSIVSLAEIYGELRKACREAGGQSAWAEMHGISPAYVSDVLNARRDPGDKILAALGFRKIVGYRKVAAALLLTLALSLPAHAAPPAPGSEDYEILLPHRAWINGLAANGMRCCDWSDTRPVKVRTVGERWQVWFRRGQIAGAPSEQWLDVPASAVIRGDNPVGMAIASWWGGQVRCFVAPGGI